MTLTKRQREVVTLLVAGMSYKRVAFALGISEHTVCVHVRMVASQLPGDAPMLRRVLAHAPELLAA